MATTVKRETLKSIGNVQDWALRQQRLKDKKDLPAPAVKVARPRPSSKPRAVKVAPAVTPVITAKPPAVPQPITEEVKDPKDNGVQEPTPGAKVRRIYSREFLIKFKYAATPFPPGAITPADLIIQYNKEFEQRERALQQENPSLTPGRPFVHFAHATTTQPTDKVVRVRKERDGSDSAVKREKTFKLRGISTDESILRSPLFRASAKAPAAKRAISPAVVKAEDKENPVTPAIKVARSSSASRRAPSPLVARPEIAKKLRVTLTTPATSAPAAPVPAVSTPATLDSPLPSVGPTPASTPIPAENQVPSPSAEKTSEDSVDVLAKKLKAVLKETDARRLAQRQKQIEYGKATLGYKDYCKSIAKSKRKREDPKTPNKYQVCSKRSWDGQIRKWRRMLHFYDPADLKELEGKEKEGDLDLEDEKGPGKFEITEADILAEEKALLE